MLRLKVKGFIVRVRFRLVGREFYVESRTASRKYSIGELYFCAGVLRF